MDPVRLELDWVYCEHEGDLHTNLDDPFQYGPQYNYKDKGPDDPDYENDPAWVLRSDVDYGKGELWFYKCPGPHFKIWIGAEL